MAITEEQISIRAYSDSDEPSIRRALGNSIMTSSPNSLKPIFKLLCSESVSSVGFIVLFPTIQYITGRYLSLFFRNTAEKVSEH